MEQERAHREDVSTPGETHHFAIPLSQCLCLVRRQATMRVRSRHDAQWTALAVTIIEMHAHGNERLQQTHWRLRIEDALFLGPAGALRVHDLALNRDAEILVQADEPVGFR